MNAHKGVEISSPVATHLATGLRTERMSVSFLISECPQSGTAERVLTTLSGSSAWTTRSLDRLVHSHEHCLRERDAERLRRLHVDRELERHRLLDRKIARVYSPENPIDEIGCAAVILHVVDAIAKQSALL